MAIKYTQQEINRLKKEKKETKQDIRCIKYQLETLKVKLRGIERKLKIRLYGKNKIS